MKSDLRRRLERVEIPDEHDTRVRAWEVVERAFAEREPGRRRTPARPLLALVAAAAVIAAVASPPGRALLGSVREAIGVERAEPALFSLPTGGRLLVSSDAGAWIVQRDGSRRLLGPYREASWSPRGLYVVASGGDELTAVDPKGTVRWKLARRDVRLPRWGGRELDTRIAYLAGSRLHVVAGDGTGDVDAGGMPAAARVAPAWWHARRHVLAYADTRGRVAVYDADAGALRFRTGRIGDVLGLEWSSRARLLIVGRNALTVYGAQGQRVWRVRLPGIVAARFSPDGRRIAVLRRQDVLVLDVHRPRGRRTVFAGSGAFRELAWSPDGDWLLVGWPAADQWVFIRVTRARRIRAVSDVSAQFGGGGFPRVEGWCCPP